MNLANVHRGVHTLSQEATSLLEDTRRRVAGFINASTPEEVIFTRGTTEAINLVAASYGSLLSEGDEVILSVIRDDWHYKPYGKFHLRRTVRNRSAQIGTSNRQAAQERP